MNKQSKPITNDKTRRVRVAALLNLGAALGALVLVAAIHTSGPKLPPSSGD